MGRSPKVSSTRKPPRTIFDVLRFTRIRMLRWSHSTWEHDQIYADAAPAIAWRPEELRAYHDEVVGHS